MEIANKVGVSEVISRIVEGLKDDNEPYRRMVMETIEQVCMHTAHHKGGDRRRGHVEGRGGVLVLLHGRT